MNTGVSETPVIRASTRTPVRLSSRCLTSALAPALANHSAASTSAAVTNRPTQNIHCRYGRAMLPSAK